VCRVVPPQQRRAEPNRPCGRGIDVGHLGQGEPGREASATGVVIRGVIGGRAHAIGVLLRQPARL
jgi:hypothetical protein